MGRKDRERFQRLRKNNPDYIGYRGLAASVVRSQSSETETVICSVCRRKRNVDNTNLPEDISQFVCLRCRESSLEVL